MGPGQAIWYVWLEAPETSIFPHSFLPVKWLSLSESPLHGISVHWLLDNVIDWILSHQNSHTEVLSHSTSKHTCIWCGYFDRIITLKMSLLVYTLTQLPARDIIRTTQKPIMDTPSRGLAQRQSRCRSSKRKPHKSRIKTSGERSPYQYLDLGLLASRTIKKHIPLPQGPSLSQHSIMTKHWLWQQASKHGDLLF